MKFGQNTALSPSSCVTLTGSIFLTKKSLKRKEIARIMRKLCVNVTLRMQVTFFCSKNSDRRTSGNCLSSISIYSQFVIDQVPRFFNTFSLSNSVKLF